MKYDGVVVLDLETTGFCPTKNKILEIGADIWIAETNTHHVFERVINVGKVPKHITKITGITTAEASKGVDIASALFDLEAFIFSHLKRPLFVGHNIIGFDMRFLSSLKWIPKRHIYDTMLIERAIHDGEIKRSFHATQLESVKFRGNTCVNLRMCCKRYRIRFVGAHRAAADCKVTFFVMVHQLGKTGWKLFGRRKNK